MDASTLLKTPLFETHQKLGAQIVDFGGWAMPVQYTTVMNEHACTRTKAGLFDICHMGEIFFQGADAEKLLNWVVTRDIAKQKIGQIFLGVMCTERGGIIDDLTVYRLNENEYMMVTNAATKDKDLRWIQQAKEDKGFVVEITDRSADMAKIDLQGPRSEEILKKLTEADVAAIPFYHFVQGHVDGIETIISRSGYTGEVGFELYFTANEATRMWNKLLEVGAVDGLQPIGLGARDTLRLECAMMLYGNDISEETTPLEARYSWVVDFDSDFIGKEALLQQKEAGLTRKLVGFEMIDRGIPRHEYPIIKDGTAVGVVTSGSYAPTLDKNIGLAYVPLSLSEIGTEFEVQIRNKNYRARVVKCPFYKRT